MEAAALMTACMSCYMLFLWSLRVERKERRDRRLAEEQRRRDAGLPPIPFNDW